MKKELDLNKPIFVIYVNTVGLTSYYSQKALSNAKKMLDIYSNITTWIVSSTENRIECVYDGKYKNKSIDKLIIQIDKIIDILSSSTSDEELKSLLRNWKLDELTKQK